MYSDHSKAVNSYYLGFAGAFALLLGIGLGRFSYTPVIPALIQAGWFTESQTAYLGAANLFGYMLGAGLAHRAALRLGERRVLALSLAVLVTSLLCCALPWGFAWYYIWRLLAGIAAGVLTVVAVTSVIVRVPNTRRPVMSAMVFTGPGVGIIASATVVPWLAERSVTMVWLGIGCIALVLSLWSWFAVWRHLTAPPHHHDPKSKIHGIPGAPVLLVIAAYSLGGIGGVPHALFWVDFIARELDLGLGTGGYFWMLFGVGSVLGPTMAGVCAAWLGFRASLVLALAITALSVALPLISIAGWSLLLSSLFVGAMTPAFVSLAAGSISELVPTGRQQQYWGWTTLVYALTIAAAGYGFSALYAKSGSYEPLFAVGAGALIMATLTAARSLRVA